MNLILIRPKLLLISYTFVSVSLFQTHEMQDFWIKGLISAREDCKQYLHIHICGKFRDLVPFVQLKKREKHQWRSVTFSKVAG